MKRQSSNRIGAAARRAVVFSVLASLTAGIVATEAPALADDYARAGWVADLPPGSHGVQGQVTIVDATTLQVDHFYYDGGGPAVYFVLGVDESDPSFENGLYLDPLLTGTVFMDDSLTLTLPVGETMDGYNAISVWCGDFNVSFSSATFVTNEYARAGWVADLPLGFHDVEGQVTIVDATTLQVDHFYYDGGGPAVYFVLGEDESNPSFENGLYLDPLLTGTVFMDDSLTLTLPVGETMDGYNAISVWCAVVGVSFSSATFEPVLCAGDMNCDGAVDFDDIDMFVAALGYPGGDGWPHDCPWANGDCDGDGDVTFDDIDAFVSRIGSGCP